MTSFDKHVKLEAEAIENMIMKRKGLAQIPLILGLLVMAVAIPVATKLVQENQDSRNQAAGCAGINQGCSTRPCCAGLTCADESSGFSYPRCIGAGSCPQGHRKCEGNNQYYCNAGNWVLEKACGSLGCDGDGCRVPACSGTETKCNDSGNQVLQCNNGVWKLLSNCSYGCSNGACKNPPPTATPTKKPTATPAPCAKSGQACSTRSCCNATDVCTNEGLSYPKCVPRAEIPTYIPVPTEVCVGPGKPCSTRSCCAGLTCTAEALAYPQCVENCSLLTNRPDNCKCTNNTHCKSKNCSGGVCKPSGRVSQPPISDKCPGAQACPDSTGNVLRDCKNPDSDGTSRDSICSAAGGVETCDGRNFCCPNAGGKWTTDMTQCPTAATCAKCADASAKGKGDANCNGVVDLVDYSIWREEFNIAKCGTDTATRNNWKADFDCNGLVNMADYNIWRNNYITMFK